MSSKKSVADRLRKLQRSVAKRFFRLIGVKRLEDAKIYVGTDETSGRLQFELLKREGLVRTSRVLEIGCGCLHSAVPLLQFLEKGHYVGIDPNEWLRQKAMEKRDVRNLVTEKEARFLSVDDFDATSLGAKFDFVLSHSVLSHSAHYQLEQFLRNAGKVLAPEGRIVASIRLAEGNAYGNPGNPNREDSMFTEWQYPGVSFFKLSTIMSTADALGLAARHVPAYTEFYTQTRAHEYHDWIVFYRKGLEGRLPAA